MNANTGTCLVPDFEVTVPCRSPENKMLSTCVLTNVHNHRGFCDPQEKTTSHVVLGLVPVSV